LKNRFRNFFGKEPAAVEDALRYFKVPQILTLLRQAFVTFQ